MAKTIDYKHQLNRIKEMLNAYFCDKVLGNAFSEYDKGHRAATVADAKEFIKVVDMALKGKL